MISTSYSPYEYNNRIIVETSRSVSRAAIEYRVKYGEYRFNFLLAYEMFYSCSNEEISRIVQSEIKRGLYSMMDKEVEQYYTNMVHDGLLYINESKEIYSKTATQFIAEECQFEISPEDAEHFYYNPKCELRKTDDRFGGFPKVNNAEFTYPAI